MNKKDKVDVIGMVFVAVSVFLMLITLLVFATEIQELEKKLDFDYIREGQCVYVKYKDNYSEGWVAEYCLVYDEKNDKTLKVNVESNLVHIKIEAGDVIIYKVNYDYTEITFLNVKNK